MIVGAGLAGLACAKKLHDAGREFVLLDASDRVGGHLKTDVLEGYRLDRGFQTLFTAYPAARELLDYSRLDLKTFEPGAMVWDGEGLHKVNRDDQFEMAFSRFLKLGDKLKMLSLSKELKELSDEEIWHMDDVSGEAMLRQYGFSEEFMVRFARPFFGGVFLDRTLSGSCRPLAFVWKMLAEGGTAVPALGIEEIPRQIAEGLPSNAIKCASPVNELMRKDGKVVGVVLSGGKKIEAESVVIATDFEQSSSLMGLSQQGSYRASMTLYFEIPVRPVFGGYIVLNGTDSGQVNHLVAMTNVSEAYAPPGRGLASVTILGESPKPDPFLAREVLYELGFWFPKKQVQEWKLLRVDRVRHAQLERLPNWSPMQIETSTPGLFLAGEAVNYGGIDGALQSGINCARLLLNQPELVPA